MYRIFGNLAKLLNVAVIFPEFQAIGYISEWNAYEYIAFSFLNATDVVSLLEIIPIWGDCLTELEKYFKDR